MNRSLLSMVFVFFVLTLILPGCQNGVQDITGRDNVSDNTTKDNTTTDNASDPAVGSLPAKISESLKAGKSVPDTLQATVAYLKALDTVADAGSATGSGAARAKLKNGRYHLIVFDPGVPTNVPASTQKGVYLTASKSAGAGTRKSQAKLASFDDLMDFVELRDGSAASVNALAAMAKQAGYSNVTADAPPPGNGATGSIEWFKGIHTRRLLYLNTAAVCFNPNDKAGLPTIWTLMTTDVWRPDLVQSQQFRDNISDDLAADPPRVMDGTIVRDYGDPATQNPAFEERYFVTQAFFEKYCGTFKPGSAVYLDGCGTWPHPGGPDSPVCSGLLTTLRFQKGATCVMGWDGTPNPADAFKTATYFFSRMFGSNDYFQVSPPNRPFGWYDSLGGLVTKSLDSAAPAPAIGNDPLTPLVIPPNPRLKALIWTNKDDQPFWRPGIQHMYVGATGKLNIGGDFGNETVTVYVGSKSLTATPSPTGGLDNLSIGTGDFGNVQVTTADGQLKSNIRPLSQWQGKFTMSGMADTKGPWVEATLNIRIRGDVGPWRNEPDVTPWDPSYWPFGTDYFFEQNCTGTYEFSGKDIPFGDKTYTWSGKGDFKFSVAPMTAGFMALTTPGLATFMFAPTESIKAHYVWLDKSGHTDKGDDPEPMGFKATTSISQFGTIQGTTTQNQIDSEKIKITIPEMKPDPAPDDKTPG